MFYRVGGPMFKKFLLFVFLLLLAVPQSFAAELLDLVPSNTEIVIRSNIKQITHIPEIKQKIQDIIKEQDRNEYIKSIKACGFNILNDVDSLLLFMPIAATNPQEALKAEIAFIVSGKFNVEKIIDALKSNNELSEKIVISEEDGFQTITSIDAEKGNSKILIIDPTTVVCGTEPGVNSAKLVKLGKREGIKSNKDFSTVIAKLNDKASVAVTAVLPNQVREYFASNEKSKPLSVIQYLSIDFTKNDNLDINVIGDFSASANMTEINKILTEFFDVMKKMDMPYDAFNDFAQNAKISTGGISATITTFVTQASIDKLIENFASPQTKTDTNK